MYRRALVHYIEYQKEKSTRHSPPLLLLLLLLVLVLVLVLVRARALRFGWLHCMALITTQQHVLQC